MSGKYHNFMENTVGLGVNGTHVAHASVAGGATWAAGQYAGIEVIADNWWSPFAAAFAGLGLSITARALMVDDEAQINLLEERMRQDLASIKDFGTDDANKLRELIDKFESTKTRAGDPTLEETRRTIEAGSGSK
jgi:hypothetical protein